MPTSSPNTSEPTHPSLHHRHQGVGDDRRKIGVISLKQPEQPHHKSGTFSVGTFGTFSIGIYNDQLQDVLKTADFDRFVEDLCKPYYSSSARGRSSLPPDRYFRMLLVGYFEGLDSERGIEWRCADSLSLREFLLLSSRETVPGRSSPPRSTAPTRGTPRRCPARSKRPKPISRPAAKRQARTIRPNW